MNYDDDDESRRADTAETERDKWRALADDLAAVLANHTDHGFPPNGEILRVLARYREARQQ